MQCFTSAYLLYQVSADGAVNAFFNNDNHNNNILATQIFDDVVIISIVVSVKEKNAKV